MAPSLFDLLKKALRSNKNLVYQGLAEPVLSLAARKYPEK